MEYNLYFVMFLLATIFYPFVRGSQECVFFGLGYKYWRSVSSVYLIIPDIIYASTVILAPGIMTLMLVERCEAFNRCLERIVGWYLGSKKKCESGHNVHSKTNEYASGSEEEDEHASGSEEDDHASGSEEEPEHRNTTEHGHTVCPDTPPSVRRRPIRMTKTDSVSFGPVGEYVITAWDTLDTLADVTCSSRVKYRVEVATSGLDSTVLEEVD